MAKNDTLSIIINHSGNSPENSKITLCTYKNTLTKEIRFSTTSTP